MAKEMIFFGPEQARVFLARRVRDARLGLGWRQSTLAERAGVSLPTVSRFERTGGTSLENFLRMCHALGGLAGFSEILRPGRARSVEELEKQLTVVQPKRGRK